MKRKPLSFEEKRQRLLKIFHDRQEVLNLKELEKYGPKEGIVLQTVKEVLDSLLADNLVLSDKIGSANFFWSLPSQAAQTMTNAIEKLDQELIKFEEEKEKLISRIEVAQSGKEETVIFVYLLFDENIFKNERKNKLNILKTLKEEYENKLKKIDIFKRNDVENLVKLQNDSEEFKKKANLWTDNIFTTENFMFLKKKFSREDISNFKKMLEIPEEIDYI